MTEINTTGEMLDLIKKNTSLLNDNKTNEAWVILLNDKQISLNNGKYVWRKINHAKSALSNQIKYSFCSKLRRQGIERFSSEEIYQQTLKDLQEDGILEFKRLI